MATAERITADRLRKLLHYDPLTGLFRWNALRKKCTPGKIAGFQEANRYTMIKLDDVRYYAHRLAWLHMTGEWPENQIDHRNRNKSDNRWSNLREATQKQNSENMTREPISKSGVTGVTWHNRDKLWRARITHNRKKITLGYFKLLADAAACRRDAEKRLFTHSTICSPQDENP